MNRLLAWFLVALIFAMSGPLQAATMASARGFEKSLYGRSAPWADKYAYCGGDPIGKSDPSGLEDEDGDDGGFSAARAQFRAAVRSGARRAQSTAKAVGDFAWEMVDPTDPWNWLPIGLGPLSRKAAKVIQADRTAARALSKTGFVVYTRDGRHAMGWMKAGSEIQAAKTFERGDDIREVNRLITDYGGDASEWLKRKGQVNIQTADGVLKKAEVHWYERAGKRYEYRYIP